MNKEKSPINVLILINGLIDENHLFYSGKDANSFFAQRLLKLFELSHLTNSEIKEIIKSGQYDNFNGKEIVTSYPHLHKKERSN